MNFQAIPAAHAAYQNAPKVAHNLIVRAASALAVKGDNAGLFGLFLNMAHSGETADAIRLVGANVRAAVREELREAAGFTRVKVKGSKESKAPDYSTASVYAGTAGGYQDAVARYPADMAQALADCQPASGAIVMHACGIPAAQSTAARVLRTAEAIRAARTAHQFAALSRPVALADGDVLAQTALQQSQAENAQLRDEMARLQETMRAMTAAQAATAE